jgi:4-hydroxy-3-polyprenylbenzoate decarboxylase
MNHADSRSFASQNWFSWPDDTAAAPLRHERDKGPILQSVTLLPAPVVAARTCFAGHPETYFARGIKLVKILVAITGASGSLYAQRLLDNLDPTQHEIHVVLSNYAQQVIATELPDGLSLPAGVKSHGLKSMNAPFASGSNPPDVMVVIPCTMGTLGRIAHGLSEDVLLRAADVVLKEKRKLILVPRETPLSLVHVKNFELLLLAGVTLIPANPSFYAGAKTVIELVDTVVARVLDHMGVPNQLAPRWAEERD